VNRPANRLRRRMRPPARPDLHDTRPLAIAAVVLGLAVVVLNAGVDVDLESLVGALLP
jgi:hypothetical protein